MPLEKEIKKLSEKDQQEVLQFVSYLKKRSEEPVEHLRDPEVQKYVGITPEQGEIMARAAEKRTVTSTVNRKDTDNE